MLICKLDVFPCQPVGSTHHFRSTGTLFWAKYCIKLSLFSITRLILLNIEISFHRILYIRCLSISLKWHYSSLQDCNYYRSNKMYLTRSNICERSVYTFFVKSYTQFLQKICWRFFVKCQLTSFFLSVQLRHYILLQVHLQPILLFNSCRDCCCDSWLC